MGREEYKILVYPYLWRFIRKAWGAIKNELKSVSPNSVYFDVCFLLSLFHI